jgi:hypothetical protein
MRIKQILMAMEWVTYVINAPHQVLARKWTAMAAKYPTVITLNRILAVKMTGNARVAIVPYILFTLMSIISDL